VRVSVAFSIFSSRTSSAAATASKPEDARPNAPAPPTEPWRNWRRVTSSIGGPPSRRVPEGDSNGRRNPPAVQLSTTLYTALSTELAVDPGDVQYGRRHVHFTCRPVRSAGPSRAGNGHRARARATDHRVPDGAGRPGAATSGRCGGGIAGGRASRPRGDSALRDGGGRCARRRRGDRRSDGD